MMGGKAAGSVRVSIPKSGNFAKAGPHLQSLWIDRHAIYYFGVGLVPAGCNVILGAITLGWLNDTFADGRSMVLPTVATTIMSFTVFVVLYVLLWLSRDYPLSSVRPISYLLQSFLIAIIFCFNGLIITINLPKNCNAKVAANGVALGRTPCSLLTSMSVLSFLPVIPILISVIVICYNTLFTIRKLPADSPMWGTWGSANAVEKGDVEHEL